MEVPAHIFIVGGTGRVGQLFITEAIKRGHQITALVRKEGILKPDQNLSTITGSPTSPADITKALLTISNPRTVIVSTLGQTRKSGNPWSMPTSPPKFMSESIQALIDAIKTLQTTTITTTKIIKLIQLSLFGAKSSFQNLSFPFRLIMTYSNMTQTIEDHNLVHDLIIENFGGTISTTTTTGSLLQIPYVMIRPAMLKFGAESDGMIKVHGDDGVGAGWMPSIQARDVVTFMVDDVLDGDESDRWDGKTPVISN